MGPDVSHLEDLSERCPPALLAQIDRVAAALDVGLVLLTLVSQDLEGGEACFVDLDVAPRLDVVLAQTRPHGSFLDDVHGCGQRASPEQQGKIPGFKFCAVSVQKADD